jgi:hypothetical protein
VNGVVPVNVPLLAVSVEPDWVVPVIVGGAVLFGATLLEAWPFWVVAKTDPIASAASASSVAFAKRPPRSLLPVIFLTPCGGFHLQV